MKKSLISVVMPCYNAGKYVDEAIQSVLAQTLKNFEFIIVDDKSTDNSLEIIKKYAKKDRRIKLLKNKKNLGIAKTRNIGTKIAKGEYIAVHDADDISLPRRFEEEADYLSQHPEVGAVGSYMEIFDDASKKIIGVRKYPLEDRELRKVIFFFSPIAQPASMIRREVFKKIGFYDERYPPAEDLDFWFRLGTEYKFGNVPKVLLKYRHTLSSATESKIKIMEKLSNEIRWKNHGNKAYKFGFKAFVYNFFHLMSIYLIPSKFKLWLFGRLRDEKAG